MFRRLPASLPPDAAFKSDLKELGYFIDEKSQIMQIKKPDKGYVFKIYNDERYNVMHREALNNCIREQVLKRATAAGLSLLYLPQLSAIKPEEPHVPIFTTPSCELKNKKRIIVVLNDHRQDLGIWDYRCLAIDGIDSGSCVKLAKLVQQDGEAAPGLIISNAGQLTYSHKNRRAMTTQSWQAMPRSSLAFPGVQEDPLHNSVEGTRDKFEHCNFIFENLLKNSSFVREDAEIYLVGILNGGEVALNYLDAHWDFWRGRIKAVALTSALIRRQTLSWEMIQFLRDRARNWKISSAPKDACLVSPLHWTLSIPDTAMTQPPEELEPQLRKNEDVEVVGKDYANDHANDLLKATLSDNGDKELTEWAVPENMVIPDAQIVCPEFSSSVRDFTEIIFPTVLDSVIAFFEDVQKDVNGYKNPAFMVEQYEEEPLEIGVDVVKNGNEAMSEGVETMKLEGSGKKEKGKDVRDKKAVRFDDDMEVEKKKEGVQEGVNFAEAMVPEVKVDTAISCKAEAEEQTTNTDAPLDTLNLPYRYPAERAEAEMARVAGLDLDEEVLKAAGLM
ncbi:hypothetical protein FKW77_009756 [Venturia effusa]|uniref:Arb2 domain-containing protein n=1 Tax=Venturia effusa TaxID=50376 RepID=A0A517LBQ1_9PEZI|nr:hypothetical protein FKW77_009756 [Venturia effusa]